MKYYWMFLSSLGWVMKINSFAFNFIIVYCREHDLLDKRVALIPKERLDGK